MESSKNNYDFERLKNSIFDIIEEQQLKLGYMSEPVRLYYPLHSVNRLIKAEANEKEMMEILEDFGAFAKADFGEIKFSCNKDRICFRLPKETSDFVHENAGGNPFIAEFIALVGTHGTKIEEIIALFNKHSDKVCIEKKTHGEFDYLCYFTDGKPDDYRYCLTDEGCHITYHRFTVEDYEDYDFDGEE